MITGFLIILAVIGGAFAMWLVASGPQEVAHELRLKAEANARAEEARTERARVERQNI